MKLILALILNLLVLSAHAQWTVTQSEDEMSGIKSSYAQSQLTPSTKPMSAPYQGTASAINIACNEEGDYWAYFYFSNKPNISNDKTQNGYSLSTNRFKVDDQLKEIKLSQTWGAKAMHVIKKDSFIDDIRTSKSTLIELQWHGQGSVIFKHDNTDSKKAIEDTFRNCGILNTILERDQAKQEAALLKAKEEKQLKEQQRAYKELLSQKKLPSFNDLPQEEKLRLQMTFKKDMTPEERTIWETR